MQNIVGQLLDISIFYHKMKKIWEKNCSKRNLMIPRQFYDGQFLPIFFRKWCPSMPHLSKKAPSKIIF